MGSPINHSTLRPRTEPSLLWTCGFQNGGYCHPAAQFHILSSLEVDNDNDHVAMMTTVWSVMGSKWGVCYTRPDILGASRSGE